MADGTARPLTAFRSTLATLAYFVSSHGFGHAARAAAVIDRLCELDPSLRIELFAGTPKWFFEQSFDPAHGPLAAGRVRYHRWDTDVGMVQATALAEDLDATVRTLEGWFPFRLEVLEKAESAVRNCDARLLVADISPLGLEVARRLEIPSVLIENFTWDWIYRGYGHGALDPFADLLAPIFAGATLRLKAEPYCQPTDSASTRIVGPIARRPRATRRQIRGRLQLPDDVPLALVTMGGVPWAFEDLEEHLEARIVSQEVHLIIAGGSDKPVRLGRAQLIPHQSEFFHPDLVAASDAVVGKLGYSTVAEVAQAGIRFGFIPRPQFPESPELERWVEQNLSAVRLAPSDLEQGTWLDHLSPLMRKEPQPAHAGGALEAAREIVDLAARPL